MAMTRLQRKEALGFGAIAELARRTGRTEGHVSQVVSGKRRDRKVEVAAARMVNRPVDDVFDPVNAKTTEAA